MSRRRLPIPYRYAIPAGIGLGLLWGLRTYLYFWTFEELEYFAWEKHVLIHVVNYLTWALLLPLVYYSVQQLYWRRSASTRTWGLVIAAGILLSLAHEAISNVLYFGTLHLLGKEAIGMHTLKHIVGVLPSAIITRLVEYGILYAILTAVEYQRRLRNQQIEMAQLESQLAGAQLSALRLQLQPHFLFNTLNTISSLMEFDVKNAQRVVSRLGNLLRTVLEKDKRNLTELREEIAFIRSYLDIEQVRFQDRLQIDYQIDESALDAAVPSLLLQPLVENAVKHGFANRTDEGRIEVKVERQGDRILLAVSDDGRSGPPQSGSTNSAGIGLQNVQERLELIYPNQHQFGITRGEEQGFSVLINIPYQKFSYEKDPHPGSR